MSGQVTKHGILQLIPLDKIDESRFQIRIDYGDIDALAASIKRDGLQQPVKLRPIGKRYETIFGDRRIRAARKAGQKYIQAYVEELSDEEAVRLHGVENINRNNLSPIEEARYYKQCKERGEPMAQIAKDHGKSYDYLYTHLALLDLPKDIQDRVHSKEISITKAQGLTILTRKKRTKKERASTQGFTKAPRTTEHYDDIRSIADDEELRDTIAVEMAAKAVRDGVPLPEAKDMAKKDYAVRMFKDRPRPLTTAEAIKALEESLPDKEKLEAAAKAIARYQMLQFFHELWEDGVLDCPVCGECGITWECSGKLIWENLGSDEDV